MSSRLWRHRVSDILTAIQKIQGYVEGMDFKSFQIDSKTSDAVIRNFIIIGEASRQMPQEITEQYPKL